MPTPIKNQYEPDFVTPPGETLEDVLDERGISQAALAERMGRTPKMINEIIKGKAPITEETALQLERVLGIPAQFWNNRERIYREHLALKEEEEYLKKCTDWVKRFPFKKMCEFQWLSSTHDTVEQAQQLLNFFAVATPKQWEVIWMGSSANAAFRKSLTFTSDPGPVSAWLRYGEICARRIPCTPFNSDRFKRSLHLFRQLTTHPPTVFVPEIQRLCAESGVAVVLTPELPKAHISGATRWLTPNQALIQISLRYKTDDHFWFTLFHEAGHVLLHGKKEIFLEGSQEKPEQQKEEEANRFAAEFLIPRKELDRFTARGQRSYDAVKQFAGELGIAPGIVVGRLQHIGYLPRTHLNKLKRKFVWKQPTALSS